MNLIFYILFLICVRHLYKYLSLQSLLYLIIIYIVKHIFYTFSYSSAGYVVDILSPISSHLYNMSVPRKWKVYFWNFKQFSKANLVDLSWHAYSVSVFLSRISKTPTLKYYIRNLNFWDPINYTVSLNFAFFFPYSREANLFF